MIRLKQKQEILLAYFHEGISQREIARRTGMDRKTIRKYIVEYEQQREELIRTKDPMRIGVLTEGIVQAPKYQVGVRPKPVVTEEVEEKIRGFLAENEERRNKGLHKQVRRPVDIHSELENSGVCISYGSVLRTVRALESKTREAYIKSDYLPGDVCEFDWGEVKLEIAGEMQKFQMAVFASAYGNYRFAWLFNKQKSECFQEVHVKFFEHIGGVYQQMVYDNMRVAVKKLAGTEKEPTDALLQLSLYYGFQFRFCNVCSGNEKGHVERSVEVVRRKAFASRYEFDSLESANEYLISVCERLNHKAQSNRDGRSAWECLQEERSHLREKLPPLDAARVECLRVDKYSTICVDKNHYSVPDSLVGKKIMVKIYSDRIVCFHDDKHVAEHPRSLESYQWIIELEHFLCTFKKKPGALATSIAMKQAPDALRKIYTSHYTGREKDFIVLVQEIATGLTLDEVKKAIDELQSISVRHVTTDNIKLVCARNKDKQVQREFLLGNESKDISEHAIQQLRQYDALLRTSSVEREAVSA
ncbi:IS21 family transposase [Alicyclobacillus acidoterrestris]|uniref:IS21 family transposase n=2 Tax=Alicyclobacillus TaxID=29330 RepID=UPI003F532BCD